MRLSFSFLMAALAAATTTLVVQALKNGDEVCAEGYIMDRFCINRGTLLDNRSVQTLRNPERHSIHCLVDVGICVNSGYIVLNDKVDGQNLHTLGWALDTNGTATLQALAQEVGLPNPGGGIYPCYTCTGGPAARVAEGMRAGINGTVVDASTDPPTIRVNSAVYVSPSVSYCSNSTGSNDDRRLRGSAKRVH